MQGMSFYKDAQAWPEVVCTAQEVVELSLKAVLRRYGLVPPRTHEMSGVLQVAGARLPETLRVDLERLADISKRLYKDRTLAFYGSEDVTPSEFYGKEDADKAAKDAEFTFGWAAHALTIQSGRPNTGEPAAGGRTKDPDRKGP